MDSGNVSWLSSISLVIYKLQVTVPFHSISQSHVMWTSEFTNCSSMEMPVPGSRQKREWVKKVWVFKLMKKSLPVSVSIKVWFFKMFNRLSSCQCLKLEVPFFHPGKISAWLGLNTLGLGSALTAQGFKNMKPKPQAKLWLGLSLGFGLFFFLKLNNLSKCNIYIQIKN